MSVQAVLHNGYKVTDDVELGRAEWTDQLIEKPCKNTYREFIADRMHVWAGQLVGMHVISC